MARMLDIRERARLRKAIYAKPTIIALLIVGVLITNAAWGMWTKSKDAVAKRNKAVAEQQALLAREAELRSDISQLSSDRGIEAEIRDRFMVAKEGENVIVISDSDKEKVHTVTVTEEAPSLFEKMKAAVGGGE